MLGTALYEAGRAEAAEPHFRAVLERQPANGPARVALAECLLSPEPLRRGRRRWHAADRPVRRSRPQAARTELFAALAAGRPADCRRGARARDGGRELPAPERRRARRLAPISPAAVRPPRTLPRDAGPLLVTMLEALLRVEEFDAFATLLPLLDAVGLPVRERSELLATMYLRRGFLDSAADEWIAVCEQQGPDAGGACSGWRRSRSPRGWRRTRAPSPRRRLRSTPSTSSRRPRSALPRAPESVRPERLSKFGTKGLAQPAEYAGR